MYARPVPAWPAGHQTQMAQIPLGHREVPVVEQFRYYICLHCLLGLTGGSFGLDVYHGLRVVLRRGGVGRLILYLRFWLFLQHT